MLYYLIPAQEGYCYSLTLNDMDCFRCVVEDLSPTDQCNLVN